MRGEHGLSSSTLKLAQGSSPHARGARHTTMSGRLRIRIIPACAGSTSGGPGRGSQMWDHPRMRGEHADDGCECPDEWGSSPHARGAHTPSLVLQLVDGIIPACAGSTRHLVPDPELVGDHPRMRGEHSLAIVVTRPPRGSSPHARGARPRGDPLRAAQGIIPACAGSTRSRTSRSLRRGDHPRMRGEHLDDQPVDQCKWGSSPHARGAPSRIAHYLRPAGIIPACAGSTTVG